MCDSLNQQLILAFSLILDNKSNMRIDQAVFFNHFVSFLEELFIFVHELVSPHGQVFEQGLDGYRGAVLSIWR